jgi:hypothetical protein
MLTCRRHYVRSRFIHEKAQIVLSDNDFIRPRSGEMRHRSEAIVPNTLASWQFRDTWRRRHAMRIFIWRVSSPRTGHRTAGVAVQWATLTFVQRCTAKMTLGSRNQAASHGVASLFQPNRARVDLPKKRWRMELP